MLNECSALGKSFNEVLDEKDKKERLFKKLKSIEGNNEEHLKTIKGQRKNFWM